MSSVGSCASGLMDACHFPDSLVAFGYCWRSLPSGDLRLACLPDGDGADHDSDGFRFDVSGDMEYNQARYNALGEVVTEEIYTMLQNRAHLQRVPLPSPEQTNTGDELSTFVFCSENWQRAPRLLLLIHGSGVVRAGQWSRRLIINNSVNMGSQLPYVQQARSRGFGVIVLNTNDNFRTSSDGRRAKIPGSGSPEEHATSVWDRLVETADANTPVAIVAHSYGGVVVTELARRRWLQVQRRVVAVALTDSVHSPCHLNHLPAGGDGSAGIADKSVGQWISRVGRNWVSSCLSLNEPVKSMLRRGAASSVEDCARFSAGDERHEWTSHAAKTAVFQFIDSCLASTCST